MVLFSDLSTSMILNYLEFTCKFVYIYIYINNNDNNNWYITILKY